MAKSRQEKITSYEERIAQLENQRRQEIQKMKAEERKARTKRLCSRHGLLESMLPEIVGITDEQYKSLIKQAVDSKLFRDMLDAMTAMSEDIVSFDAEQAAQANSAEKSTNSTVPSSSENSQSAGTAAQIGSAPASSKAEQTGQSGNNSGSDISTPTKQSNHQPPQKHNNSQSPQNTTSHKNNNNHSNNRNQQHNGGQGNGTMENG